MDYFLLEQDKRYIDTPVLTEIFKKIDIRNINILNEHKIPETIIFHVNANKESIFTDILDNQIYIISKNLKKLIEKYKPETIFKTIPLIDLKHEKQETYYLPIYEEIEALSSKSEFNLDKSVIKKLILSKEKIKKKKIFKIKESQKPKAKNSGKFTSSRKHIKT